MNRAERRRQGKMPKDPMVSMKKSDIARIKKEAAETAIILLLSIPVKVMQDKFGWGKKRLEALSSFLIDEYQAFSDGEMTLLEYQDMVYEQCGIKFQRNEEDT